MLSRSENAVGYYWRDIDQWLKNNKVVNH